MNLAFKPDKLVSLAGVAVLHGGFAFLLILGLGRTMDPAPPAVLKAFDVSVPPPPPEAPVPERKVSNRPEGAAAPPARKAEATNVVAPAPVVVVPPVTPLIAAPVAGPGTAASQGAAEHDGPGTGAGGIGIGTGSGGRGEGTGGGIATRARQISGRIVNADYPRDARRQGAEGEVLVRFTIRPDGRVGSCALLRSSGHPKLDATTCRLIERRYRFEPARNALGAAVSDEKVWLQRWWLERD